MDHKIGVNEMSDQIDQSQAGRAGRRMIVKYRIKKEWNNDSWLLTDPFDPLQLFQKALEILREAGHKLDIMSINLAKQRDLTIILQVCSSHFCLVLIPPEPEKDESAEEWGEWLDIKQRIARFEKKWLIDKPRRSG